MFSRIIDFYKISSPSSENSSTSDFKRLRWATFLSATVGYALYYVCRLSMNIVRKPIVEDGVFTETELGSIGSCLFFVYAVGKMANGFLADRCNARRFLATGLLLTAIVNLVLGLTNMFIVFAVLLIFMRDTPQSQGFLLDRTPTVDNKKGETSSEDFNKAQKAVLKSPAIWILALASAFMYISRYAVNSWGVFYLEAQKGYDTLDASLIISISSVCGIVGTVASGLISDKFFNGSRNVPALVFGLMNVAALCLFLLVPGENFWIDVTAMVMFGLGIGVTADAS
ncbi:MAG: MFS transporter [Muribaculaceae bacterium]|nr:MFS transporter [Muribaculaceae bacterium]